MQGCREFKQPYTAWCWAMLGGTFATRRWTFAAARNGRWPIAPPGAISHTNTALATPPPSGCVVDPVGKWTLRRSASVLAIVHRSLCRDGTISRIGWDLAVLLNPGDSQVEQLNRGQISRGWQRSYPQENTSYLRRLFSGILFRHTVQAQGAFSHTLSEPCPWLLYHLPVRMIHVLYQHMGDKFGITSVSTGLQVSTIQITRRGRNSRRTSRKFETCWPWYHYPGLLQLVFNSSNTLFSEVEEHHRYTWGSSDGFSLYVPWNYVAWYFLSGNLSSLFCF